MNKDLARDILNVLNTPAIMGVIERYADAQIERAKMNLLGVGDMNSASRYQGMAQAMAELKKIRDYAIDVAK